MVSEVAWGDGSGDKIYLTYSASEGNQTVAVSSDANGGTSSRSKTITFSASGVSPVTLTVIQAGGTPVIPTGYTQVQYLEMNGSGYISFGDRGSEARDAVEVDLEITTLTAQMRLVSTNTSNSPFQIFVSGALEMGYRFKGSYVSAGISLDTNRHIYGIDYYNHRVYRDTTEVAITGTSTNATSGNIGIAVKLGNNPQLKAKVYAAKMWRDGAALRNLIMCRDGNNAPYAYDTVSQTFMTIGGSGTTVGPDVTP